jgi:hypothetical protein
MATDLDLLLPFARDRVDEAARLLASGDCDGAGHALIGCSIAMGGRPNRGPGTRRR